MANEQPDTLTLRSVTPSIASFEFRIMLPDRWKQLETPVQTLDYSDTAAFLALAVFVDEPTYSVLAVAARPGYGDGTVLDWLRYAVSTQKLSVETFEPFTMSAGAAASALAAQENEGGRMKMRAVALEDGANLFMLTAMTLSENYQRMKEPLDRILQSFTLARPQGQTVPIVAGEDGQTAPDAGAG